MKMLVKTALLTLGIASLAACGSDEAPSAPEGTTVPEGDEWTAKPDDGVDVTLPETPVTTETATPAQAQGATPPPASE